MDAGVERGGGQVGEDDEGKGSRPAPSRCTQPTHNKHEQAAVWESSRALDWRRYLNVSHIGQFWRARNTRAAFSITRFGVGFNMAVWPLEKESSQGPAATAATYASPRHTPRAILIINGPRNFKITCNHLPDQWKSTFHRNSIEKHYHYVLDTRTTLSPCLLVWLVGVMAAAECAPPYHSLTLTRASASARFAYATNADAARPTIVPHLRMRTSISRTNIVSVPRTELHRHFPGVSYN